MLPKESKAFNPSRQRPDALVIECMVNPDVDIARAAGKMDQVCELFAETRRTLQEGLVAVQTAIDAGVLSGSVLKKVLGVSQEVSVSFLLASVLLILATVAGLSCTNGTTGGFTSTHA